MGECLRRNRPYRKAYYLACTAQARKDEG
ncbi:TPA: hypothetical protein ACU917_005862 [Klebsiella michiganensis]